MLMSQSPMALGHQGAMYWVVPPHSLIVQFCHYTNCEVLMTEQNMYTAVWSHPSKYPIVCHTQISDRQTVVLYLIWPLGCPTFQKLIIMPFQDIIDKNRWSFCSVVACLVLLKWRQEMVGRKHPERFPS
jgi:hypothetical protein